MMIWKVRTIGISQQISLLITREFYFPFFGYITTPVMAHHGFLEKLSTYS